MELTRLGRTNLMVMRTSFGMLPIQRTEMSEAVRILRKAYDAGINFYDTARGYTDSEEKFGRAFSDIRENIIIATKCPAANKKQLLEYLETSLKTMRTDYVDIIQLHNLPSVPDLDDPESACAGLLEAKKKGMARFIGYTNHGLERTITAIDSGFYDTIQYPICHISSDEDLAVIEKCRKADIGLIGMKALSGGLLTNMRAAFAFLRQYENLVPIWGIQHMHELDELLELDANPPTLDAEIWDIINKDREELAGVFCRACGYCQPCQADIMIPMAARMTLLLGRMPYRQFLTDEYYEHMHRIENCTDCGHCREHCPYGLDTPSLLRKQLVEYEAFYQEHIGGTKEG